MEWLVWMAVVVVLISFVMVGAALSSLILTIVPFHILMITIIALTMGHFFVSGIHLIRHRHLRLDVLFQWQGFWYFKLYVVEFWVRTAHALDVFFGELSAAMKSNNDDVGNDDDGDLESVVVDPAARRDAYQRALGRLSRRRSKSASWKVMLNHNFNTDLEPIAESAEHSGDER